MQKQLEGDPGFGPGSNKKATANAAAKAKAAEALRRLERIEAKEQSRKTRAEAENTRLAELLSCCGRGCCR
jgi:hypothetical protein